MTANEWDEYASGWDTNEDVKVYARKAFDSLAQKVLPLVPDLETGRVLDFGCGTGLLSEKLAPLCSEVVSVDTSSKMVEVLRSKLADASIHNVTTLATDINLETLTEYPQLAGKFNLIVASSVCSFLPNYERTLVDLATAIDTGGFFVQWDWLADMPIDRIGGAFEVAGLTEVSIEETFAIETASESMPVVMGIGKT